MHFLWVGPYARRGIQGTGDFIPLKFDKHPAGAIPVQHTQV
ncbi:MAG: hypothetical protein P8Z42_00995 [Anaerolineales bacterium]